MNEGEAKTFIYLMWSDKLTRTCVLLIIILSLFLTVSLSFLSGIIILVAYVGGFIAFNSIFRSRVEAPNLLSIITGRQRGTAGVAQHKLCGVCGNNKCNRHQTSSASLQPWLGLNLPKEVDQAIADFLNRTLDEFVYTWYQGLSTDENFVQELRLCIRQAASTLLRKGLQLDLADLITGKLIPAGLSHVDDYLGTLRTAARRSISLEQAGIEYLGVRLHPAAKNRTNELSYLRHLTTLLLPQLLLPTHLSCRTYSVLMRELLSGWVLLPLSDVLADPAIVNSLLLLLLERHNLTRYPNKAPQQVEFLARFVSAVPTTRSSALCLDVSSVLKDQELLYPFMQFLKGQGSVNVLQFCLDVEEFNRKMLTPELSCHDLDNLYKEAWDLFSVYFSPESPDMIHFGPQVVKEMKAVLHEPAENIVKLRTTPPLFQAYEFAYSQLENIHCPLFQQSDNYYLLLCGQRLPSGYNKSGSRAMKKWSEGGAVARISSRLHKIKGALRAQPLEGHTYDSDAALDLGETEFAEDLHLTESSTYRDLNAWRVSIPSVENRQDINNKHYPVFNIDVQRIDVQLEDDAQSYHWVVERRYNDFYVLESKLTEFHGEFSDTHLPPKRILFGPRGLEFMESKRQVFEEFLQRLLQKPNLRGSDLLHTFLRAQGEFVPSSGSLAGAVNEGLGKMLRRSVPLRLRKEKGQHLDLFLNTFLTSTEAGRPKSSKFEWKDVSVEMPRKVRCLTRGVFRDNFGMPYPTPPPPAMQSLATGSSNVPITGIFDCFLYLGVRVFGASQSVVRVVMSIRALMHNTLDALVNFCLNRKLRTLLVAPRLAHLINLLQGAVFNPRGPPPTQRDLEDRARLALELLQSMVPGMLSRWCGTRAGLLTLFSAVQNPALNKQLVYILLDIVTTELYPELAGVKNPPQVTDKLTAI